MPAPCDGCKDTCSGGTAACGANCTCGPNCACGDGKPSGGKPCCQGGKK
nr:metallothionein 1 [Ostrinia furnacalis]